MPQRIPWRVRRAQSIAPVRLARGAAGHPRAFGARVFLVGGGETVATAEVRRVWVSLTVVVDNLFLTTSESKQWSCSRRSLAQRQGVTDKDWARAKRSADSRAGWTEIDLSAEVLRAKCRFDSEDYSAFASMSSSISRIVFSSSSRDRPSFPSTNSRSTGSADSARAPILRNR